VLRIRVIPCLLVQDGALVKTIEFKNPAYIGDPINAVKIFNELEVDEIIVLDIKASREGRPPDFKLIGDIAAQCFMPLTYGGAVRSVDDFQRLFAIGVAKVAVNSAIFKRPELISEAAARFGSQSIIASIDVKKNLLGKSKVFLRGNHEASKIPSLEPAAFARQMEKLGAGEILLNSVDRDGTMTGYDCELIRAVSSAVEIPVIACGGARQPLHFREAVEHGGASAVAAGSMFVYQSALRSVLINFPDPAELQETFAGL